MGTTYAELALLSCISPAQYLLCYEPTWLEAGAPAQEHYHPRTNIEMPAASS